MLLLKLHLVFLEGSAATERDICILYILYIL